MNIKSSEVLVLSQRSFKTNVGNFFSSCKCEGALFPAASTDMGSSQLNSIEHPSWVYFDLKINWKSCSFCNIVKTSSLVFGEKIRLKSFTLAPSMWSWVTVTSVFWTWVEEPDLPVSVLVTSVLVTSVFVTSAFLAS